MRGARREDFRRIDADGRGRVAARERADEFDRAAQVRDAVNVHARDDRRLVRVLFGQQERLDASVARPDGDGQRALDRAHATVERKLSDGEHVRQAFEFAEIAVRAEDAERDGEVEARALFAHVGGREVDRRLVEREEEAAVVDGGADALARLANGGIGQTDDGDGRRTIDLVSRGREIDLNIDEIGVDAVDGG